MQELDYIRVRIMEPRDKHTRGVDEKAEVCQRLSGKCRDSTKYAQEWMYKGCCRGSTKYTTRTE
jgi:hypothetical protein